MKINPKQYAQSLYESLSGKSEEESRKILHNFVAVLGRDGVLNRENEIISAFEEIWNQENGELPASISSAHQLADNSREAITDYLKNKTGAKKIVLTEEVDQDLLGGFVLKYESRVLDGSLKTNLEDLKNKMEK
ncbi:MAG: ATP synthase F1 subunit delta [Patescibacteria group bacterium]|nr:ATP synthase F1 subunit delta [Patescibacteria group bacterium]